MPEAIETAYQHYADGEYHQAKEICQHLLAESPGQGDVLHLLGLIAFQQEEHDAAIEHLLNAAVTQQGNPSFLHSIGLAYQAKDQLDKAIGYFKQALKLEPDSCLIRCSLGVALQQKGTIDEAIDIFEGVLLQDPDYVSARNHLGVLCQKQGNLSEAIGHYQKVLEAKPDSVDVLVNMGLAFQGLGQWEKAAECYQKALQLKPDFVEASLNYGVVLFNQRKLDNAEACFRRVLQHTPDNAQSIFNLGNILREQGKSQDAVQFYERALQLAPNVAEISLSLGVTYHELDRLDKATFMYHRAIQLNPALVDAYKGLGRALRRQGKLADAYEAYQKALSIRQEGATYHNFGLVCLDMGRIDEAIHCFQSAIQLKPDLFEPYESLGNTLLNIGRTEEAINALEEAYQLRPLDRLRFKIATALPRVFQSTEEIQQWRSRLMENVRQLQQHPVKVDNPLTDLSVVTYFTTYHGLLDREIHEALGTLFSEWRQWQYLEPPQNQKPKIGFVSRHFLEGHSIWHTFRGVVDKISRETFDVVVFTVGSPHKSPCSSPHTHIDLPLNLGEACELILQQKLDLLFYTDIWFGPITGFLAQNRLAPVQCVTWGHPDTTGINTLDYFISSRLFETEASDEHYTEQLVRLETLPVYFYRPVLDDTVVTREQFGLTAEDHVYLCPQYFLKLHPDFDEILGNILRKDPKGVVLLASGAYKEWNIQLMSRLKRRIPDALNRIRFFKEIPFNLYLHLVTLSDVFLDTPYFGGGRTTYEALALGAPIVTMPTELMRGRMTYACYQKMGMMDCVASTPEEYVDIAVRLGTDPDYRETLKSKILEVNHVLYEDTAMIEELEAFFLKAIETARKQGAEVPA